MQLKLQSGEGDQAILQKCLIHRGAHSCRAHSQFFASIVSGTGVFLRKGLYLMFSLVVLTVIAYMYVSMMVLVQPPSLPASVVAGAM